MNRFLHFILVISSCILLSSCATIIGGSKYYAHVKLPDHPLAKISYKGEFQGTGQAMIKVKRSEADKLSIVVKEEGLNEQTFNFTSRSFRGWAFVGTIVGWTGLIGGIPLPWGVAVDLSTGALYKPNTKEKGVSKMDYKNYNYVLDYKGSK
jgi:hypothetical protein